MTYTRPEIEETISICIEEFVCTLSFRRHGGPDDLFPIYEVELLVNGEEIYLAKPRYWKGVPDFIAPEKMGVGKLLRLFRGILDALDQWGKDHPQSFITTDNYEICAVQRTLWRKGIICSGRLEQWLVFYDELGHRTLFVGMLNLIEDKLYAVNDLWRVAKDTRYYLGSFSSPVDWLKEIIQSGGDELEVL